MWLKAGLGVDTQESRGWAGSRCTPRITRLGMRGERAGEGGVRASRWTGEKAGLWARNGSSSRAHAGASYFDVSIPKARDQAEISGVGLTNEYTIILDGNSKPIGVYLDVGPLGRVWVSGRAR